jgi:ParB family chromosome partitioning protein
MGPVASAPFVADQLGANGGEPAEVQMDGLAPVPGARYVVVPVAAIEPNAKQPRQVFDEEGMEELKASIEEVGFLQPIVVREIAPERYELVMGERRWRAAQSLGREVIPAIVRDTRMTRCSAMRCWRTSTG